MNSFGALLIFALFACHSSMAAPPTTDQVSAECAKKFIIPQPEKDDLTNGNFNKISADGKCYLDCISKGMGLSTNGVINEANVVAFYSSVLPKMSPDVIKASVTKCSASLVGSNDCEKSFNAHKCIHAALNASQA